MPILQFWRGVWERAKEYAVYNAFPPETATIINQYADEAYRACVRWFGPPTDAQKPYKIMQGERSFFTRDLGQPVIVISKTAVSKEQLCEIIAHEMYHRVTEGRKGLADELWIKEMMAILTSHWFLRNQGFQTYAEKTKSNLFASAWKADMSVLQKSSSSSARRYLLFGTPFYSDAFAQSVWRIGYALKEAVKVNDLLSIVKASTLQEWIASLPPEDQYAACCVLELPTEDKAMPAQNRELNRLRHALEAKGDKHALAAEFEQIAKMRPANSEAFFYLGLAYQKAEYPEDALRAYNQAKDMGYSDRWLVYNIGSVYWQTKNYELAAESFEKSAEQSPDWAQPLYFLGRSLNNLGNVPAAHQAWKKCWRFRMSITHSLPKRRCEITHCRRSQKRQRSVTHAAQTSLHSD